MRFLSNLLASTLGALIALAVSFFVILLFVFALAASGDTVPPVSTGSILVMELGGPVPELTSDDPLMQAFSNEAPYSLLDIRQSLKKAAVDERIDGVWLRIEGVSASWSTLSEIRRAVLDFKKSGKPVFASSDDYSMDEGDYYLASAADSVYASPEALFEFNGFYLNVEYYKGLFDKLSIEPQVIRAGRYKSAVEPFFRTDMSPENREQLSALLGTVNDAFFKAVSESRNIPVETLRRVASDSALFSAAEAHKAGLLDGLLFRDEVVKHIKRRLGKDDVEEIPTISFRSYKRVPSADAGLKTGDEGEIAMVYAVGTIMSGSSGYNGNPLMGGETVGAETFNKAMKEARENDRIKAIVLRINSPGGFAPAADVMWREIKLASNTKPVIVSMGDLAASGGYWIATAADTIVADPLTITGSIGVFGVFFDMGGLFSDKLGISFETVRTSPYADMLSGVRSLTPDEQALLERSTRQTYHSFLKKVSESRGLTVAQVDSVGQGRVWPGTLARQKGLVDVLGGMDTAVELAARAAGLKEGSYRIRVLPRPKTFLDELNEALRTRVMSAWYKFNYTPAERTLFEQARTLDALSRQNGTIQARLPGRLDIR